MRRNESLTDIEKELLNLIFKGLNNQRIAESLDKSKNTIAAQIGTMYKKIGVENRVEAIRWGLDQGILK